MPTLTITQGLPGSGKSTWAKQQPGYRVNRDSLRAMLLPAPWPYGDEVAEDVCTTAQFAAIRSLLACGYDVIVDDTNLLSAHVEALHELVEDLDDVDVETRNRFLDVPLEECIRRDALRPEGERVGEVVIRSMWERYLDDLATIG